MDNKYDVMIIGGGAAGLTAGIYSSRAKLSTIILNDGAVGGQMVLTDESWALIKNTENVTHFLGTAREPMPIRDTEMQTILKRMGMQSEGPVIDLAVGDQVVVLIGPFADFNGIIQEIDYDKQKAKVMLSVFGRETPVELSFNEIEKTSDV